MNVRAPVTPQFMDSWDWHCVNMIFLVPKSAITPKSLKVSDIFLPLVKDHTKNNPLWSLPGGKREHNYDRTPEDTIIREVEEEIGILLDSESDSRPVFVQAQDMRTHKKYAYVSVILLPGNELPLMKTVGDEGEEVASFTLGSIMRGQVDILAPHYEVLQPVLERVYSPEFLSIIGLNSSG